MSCLTYFWTSNNKTPGCVNGVEGEYREDYFDAGDWSVPLLWTLCFSSEDVSLIELEDDESGSYGASCDTSSEKAASNLRKRMPSILKITPEKFHSDCNSFLTKLENGSNKFVHLDLTLLLENEDAPEKGDWKIYWSDLLKGANDPM